MQPRCVEAFETNEEIRQSGGVSYVNFLVRVNSGTRRFASDNQSSTGGNWYETFAVRWM